MITISPVSRVEGDLEVTVDIKDGLVRQAYASGVSCRRFEKLLRGRDPMDALVFTCRVCGICCTSHSVASSSALRDAFKARIPANGLLTRNIVLACESAMSHFTHFYVSFMPDVINQKYTAYGLHSEIVKRFSPFTGTSYHKAYQLRRRILEIVGLLAGKWPNTLAFHPGGTTKALNHSEIFRAKGIHAEFKNSLETILLGCSLDRWLQNKSLEQLKQWMGEGDHEQSDLGLFLRWALDAGLDKIGAGPRRFISSGGYDLPDGKQWLKRGYFDGELHPLEQEKITEHVKYSWLEGPEDGKHPCDEVIEPNVDKPHAYTWAKAPRYEGKSIEVGPLARMIVDKDALIFDLLQKTGPSVFARCLARVHEGIRLVKQIGTWLHQIDPDQPYYIKHQSLPGARGIGLTEAARGTLGHWIIIEGSKIKNYQIVTPSTWNLSPRDSQDKPGPLEEALIGTPVDDEKNPIEVAHVVRSYDPCVFCTVHAIRGNRQLARFSLQ